MLKTLLKKQLLEINRSFFLNPKTGKSRGRAGSILWIVLYAVLVVGVLGGLFVWVSSQLCTAMTGLGLDWLYFTVLGLMAVALGVFGSVFNTYAGLYLAKDNDLLLSMPIPVRYILMSRLLGVYLMGLLFSGVVMIPAAAVYAVQGACTAATLLGAVLSVLVVSLTVLILSCLLGWVVAQISRRLKNKSFITVLASLAFLAVYYLFYFRATELLGALVENATSVGGTIRRAAYPLYAFGQMGAGNLWAALAVTAAVLLLTVLTCYVLSRGFLKLATASVGTGRAVYREREAKVRSVDGALLQKELRRFIASPTYMLNCGLATLLLPAAAIALLLKGGWLAELLNQMFEPDTGAVAVLAITAIEWLAASNIISTPSVSLEADTVTAGDAVAGAARQAVAASAADGDSDLCVCALRRSRAGPLRADSTARGADAVSLRAAVGGAGTGTGSAQAQSDLEQRGDPHQAEHERDADAVRRMDVYRPVCRGILHGRGGARGGRLYGGVRRAVRGAVAASVPLAEAYGGGEARGAVSRRCIVSEAL